MSGGSESEAGVGGLRLCFALKPFAAKVGSFECVADNRIEGLGE